jgi:alpha-tubulin suppressor-like RCC1 family protein
MFVPVLMSATTTVGLIAGALVATPTAFADINSSDVQSLYAVGTGGSGQLGTGGTFSSFTPLPVAAPLSNGALSIDVNLSSSIAVAVDGSVWTWGSNSSGFLGTGQGFAREGGLSSSAVPVAPQLPPGQRFTQVAAGMNHALALSTAGQVYAWGWNGHGQLGTGDAGPDPEAFIPDDSSDVPLSVPIPGTVKLVGASNYRSVAITAADQVYAWGINSYDNPIPGARGSAVNTPTLISMPPFSGTITKVVVDNYATFLLTSDGQVIAWGDNPRGQFGIGSSTWRLASATLLPHQNVKDVASVGTTSYYLLGDRVWAAGYNGFGQLGYGTTPEASYTLLPVALPVEPIVAIYGGSAQGFAVTETGKMYNWGSDKEGSSGTGAGGIAWKPIPAFPGAPGFPLDMAVSFHTLVAFGKSPYHPPLAAPANVQAVLSGASAVLTWAPPVGEKFPVTGYVAASRDGAFRCTTETTSCTMTGLAKGTPYEFTVKALNRYGEGPASSPSESVTYLTVPDKPASVSVNILSKKRRQAQAAWTIPSDAGGTTITSYSWRWFSSKTGAWSPIKETTGLQARFRWPLGTTSIAVEVWANNSEGAGPTNSARFSVR